jgi:hypothetical protein
MAHRRVAPQAAFGQPPAFFAVGRDRRPRIQPRRSRLACRARGACRSYMRSGKHRGEKARVAYLQGKALFIVSMTIELNRKPPC